MRLSTFRAEINIVNTETLLDLLDLYTHHRPHTPIGQTFPLDNIIAIRIELNKESSANGYERYTEWHSSSTDDSAISPKAANKSLTNGAASRNGTTPASPAIENGGRRNTPSTTLSSTSPAGISPSAVAATRAIGARGQSGTVRFMLDAAREREEKEQVDRYFRVEEEEYEVEVEVPHTAATMDRRRDIDRDRLRDRERERERDRERDRRDRERDRMDRESHRDRRR